MCLPSILMWLLSTWFVSFICSINHSPLFLYYSCRSFRLLPIELTFCSTEELNPKEHSAFSEPKGVQIGLDSYVEENFKIQAHALTPTVLSCMASVCLIDMPQDPPEAVFTLGHYPWKEHGKNNTDGQVYWPTKTTQAASSNSDVWLYLTCHLGNTLPSGRKLVGLPSSKAKTVKTSSSVSCTVSCDLDHRLWICRVMGSATGPPSHLLLSITL